MKPRSRRHVLRAAVSGLVAGVAGCIDGPTAAGPPGTSSSGTTGSIRETTDESVQAGATPRTAGSAGRDGPTSGTSRESVPRPPQARFEFEASGSTLTVTHAGGESFTESNTSWLAVSVDEGCGGLQPVGEGCAHWRLPVEPGGSVEVDGVAGGDRILVIWFRGIGRGELRRAVAEFTVPRTGR